LLKIVKPDSFANANRNGLYKANGNKEKKDNLEFNNIKKLISN